MTASPAPASASSVSPTELLAGRVDKTTTAARVLDDPARPVALDVKAATEAFHCEGLVTIVQRLKADQRGKERLFELVVDELVYSLLALHGIVRTPPLVRACDALAWIRPYLESHGGYVELLDIDDGVAKVRLLGSCNGSSMSSQTLTNAVQTALVEHVPEIAGPPMGRPPTCCWASRSRTRVRRTAVATRPATPSAGPTT